MDSDWIFVEIWEIFHLQLLRCMIHEQIAVYKEVKWMHSAAVSYVLYMQTILAISQCWRRYGWLMFTNIQTHESMCMQWSLGIPSNPEYAVILLRQTFLFACSGLRASKGRHFLVEKLNVCISQLHSILESYWVG